MAHTIPEIVEGLNCFTTKQHKCERCPYNPKPGQEWAYGCMRGQGEIVAEAQESLKQYAEVMEKGRVLWFDEIEYYTVVWLEDRDKSDLLLAVCQKDAPSEKRFIGLSGNGDIIVGKKYDYMKRWRAWNDEPKKWQREAAKWDE